MLECCMLQPLDIVVALKYLLLDGAQHSFDELEKRTGISASSIHRSTNRLQDARLLTSTRRVQRPAFQELLIHGIRYVYYVKPGEPTRGYPTAWAASPLSEDIVSSDFSPVWPHPMGTVRGYAVMPLHESATIAALKDDSLYQLLALVDAIRIGDSRERSLASAHLTRALRHPGSLGQVRQND